jgi:hypothetical protein
MKLKHALWATALWTVLALGACAVCLWYLGTHPVPGAPLERRARQLGEGAGTVMALGYAAVWLPFAYQLGKRRQAQRAREERRKTGGR